MEESFQIRGVAIVLPIQVRVKRVKKRVAKLIATLACLHKDTISHLSSASRWLKLYRNQESSFKFAGMIRVLTVSSCVHIV